MRIDTLRHKAHRALPPGLSFFGEARPVSDLRFLADLTWTDDQQTRHVDQQIFDVVLEMIRRAKTLIVIDVFLLNPFQGRVPETTRLLSSELVGALIAQCRAYPELAVTLISDPINTVYGVRVSEQFRALEAAGVRVVITDLDKLRDSSPVYSWIWRWFIRPFGVGHGGMLTNPLARNEKVTLRSYLAAMNFKANHRKVFIADDGDSWLGLVTSANPHDASSAHHNVAVRFSGPAVADLLETENAVLRFCGEAPVEAEIPLANGSFDTSIRVLTEGAVRTALSAILDASSRGERIDFVTFYLSERTIIRALLNAHGRGVRLRVLLDPNKDAFGHDKRGIPNRPVAAELNRAGVNVRWVHTHGEQCHAKLLLHSSPGNASSLLLGSSNLTRRNLNDFNLESDILVQADSSISLFDDARTHFERLWNNEKSRNFSVTYAHYHDESFWKRIQYRLGEWTGISTW
jgi:HKD family nuclease